MKQEQEQPDNEITADMTVDTVTRRHPQAAAVLLRHGVNCVGCYISVFHDIATVSKQNNLELKALLAELNAAIEESPAPHQHE
jgi:hybrid cluster-associated redox disulfide protein